MTLGQFHQRSTRSFYVRRLRAQLFCGYVLGLYFTGARLFWCKSCAYNVGEIDPLSLCKDWLIPSQLLINSFLPTFSPIKNSDRKKTIRRNKKTLKITFDYNPLYFYSNFLKRSNWKETQNLSSSFLITNIIGPWKQVHYYSDTVVWQ